MRVKRFTLDGDEQLERRLEQTCAAALAGVRAVVPPRRLEALLLGGGYGRGEGGVLSTANGDQPYNDLEFYVLLRGNGCLDHLRYGERLHRLGRDLTPEAGVEVEFKVLSRSKLRSSPASMFYYDLVAGHRQLWGVADWLSDCERRQQAHLLPICEATRLMMNRCSGLLFAGERLRRESFSAEDADFVGRNLAKAQLAFGDALLTVFNQYHWSCRERNRRLAQFVETPDTPWLDKVRWHHVEGVRFKLRPWRTRAGATTLRAHFADISALALQLWLWLEGHRLKRGFNSALDYAACPLDKCPETSPWRNRLVNASLLGPLALFKPQSRRHPRERIFNALALLLWESHRPESDWLLHLQEQLHGSCSGETLLVERYQALWRRLS